MFLENFTILRYDKNIYIFFFFHFNTTKRLKILFTGYSFYYYSVLARTIIEENISRTNIRNAARPYREEESGTN